MFSAVQGWQGRSKVLHCARRRQEPHVQQALRTRTILQGQPKCSGCRQASRRPCGRPLAGAQLSCGALPLIREHRVLLASVTMAASPVAVQDAGRRLKSIIGLDNRQRVEDMGYPHTAIGQLRYVQANSNGNFLCTGTLFSERHVLTNAHCVYDKESRQYHSNWLFIPGLQGSSEPFGRVKCAPCFSSPASRWRRWIVTWTVTQYCVTVDGALADTCSMTSILRSICLIFAIGIWLSSRWRSRSASRLVGWESKLCHPRVHAFRARPYSSSW